MLYFVYIPLEACSGIIAASCLNATRRSHVHKYIYTHILIYIPIEAS